MSHPVSFGQTKMGRGNNTDMWVCERRRADVVKDACGELLHPPPTHCASRAAALRITKNPLNPFFLNPPVFYSRPRCCDIRLQVSILQDYHIYC